MGYHHFLKNLHEIYMDAIASEPDDCHRLAERLVAVAEQIQSSECKFSQHLLSNYFRLVALHRPELAGLKLPDATDQASAREKHVDAPGSADATRHLDIEYELQKDPSRPEFWIDAAIMDRQRGHLRRAHALLRRTCASGFAARKTAQRELAQWVASYYEAA
jgi:hypothetical protein